MTVNDDHLCIGDACQDPKHVTDKIAALRDKHPLASPGWLAYISSVTERTGLPDCDFPVCQPGCPDSCDNLCSRLYAIFEASTEDERAHVNTRRL